MTIYKKMVTMAALAGVVMGLSSLAVTAQAAAAKQNAVQLANTTSPSFDPATVDAVESAPDVATAPIMALRGQCGGRVHNVMQYMNNLAVFGAVPAAANVNRSAGYSPTDGSFMQWLKDRVIVTRLAAPATIQNFGCNAHGLFNAGTKHLPKGWPVLVALPSQFSKADIKTSPAPGRVAVAIRVHLVGQASCTNPGKAVVVIIIYVVKAKTPKQPVSQPGNCTVGSIVIVGNNNTVNVCVVIVTCGIVQVQFGTMEQAQQFINTAEVCKNTTPKITPTPCQCQPPPTSQPPPSKPRHSCTASHSGLQKDERTATFTVTCDGPISSAVWHFANGDATGTTVTHTFSDAQAGTCASGAVNVFFSDGADAVQASTCINIPAPPPNGNTGPPPMP